MKAFSLFVVQIVGIVLSAFVSSMLWLWFVVPLGVPAISLFQAMGLLMLFHAAQLRLSDILEQFERSKAEPDKSTQAMAICALPVYWLSAWGLGYIIHLCM